MNLADRMKFYESLATKEMATPCIPLIARMDGKSFHTFTSKLKRPYDIRFSELMVKTTKFLVKETGALVGYTQSDEITLLFYSDNLESQIFFNGRLFKMTSILASLTSVYFNRNMEEDLLADVPWSAQMPVFDARVWSVPTLEEAANVFLWRELDAIKNSITMAASVYYSHNQLQNKNSREKKQMLLEKGVNWDDDYPSFFKRGTYIQTRKTERLFSPEELERLPEKHAAHQNPELRVIRSDVIELECVPPLLQIQNKVDFLFWGKDPQTLEEEEDENE